MYVRIGTLLKISRCQMAQLTQPSGLVVPGTWVSSAICCLQPKLVALHNNISRSRPYVVKSLIKANSYTNA